MDRLEWLAGVLEGEGSFFPGPPSKPNVPVVAMATTDRDVAERVSAFFGTNVVTDRVRKEHWKQSYRVTVKGRRAMDLMRSLRPLMGKRRQGQIDRALASHDPAFKYRNGKTALTWEQAGAIRLALMAGGSPRALADEYGVSYDVVTSIKAGRSYKGA